MEQCISLMHAPVLARFSESYHPTSKEVLRSVDAMPELHLSSQNLSTVCGIDFTTWVMRQLIRKEPHACKCTLLEQSMELQAEIKALDPRLVGRERNRQPGLRTMKPMRRSTSSRMPSSCRTASMR